MSGTYDTHELAWAAGLFDGEGYIGAAARNSRVAKTGRSQAPLLQMAVVQWHDPAVLTRFQKAVGGLGSITSRVRERQSTEYIWRSGSFEVVQTCVALLWRWLSSPKRAQATRTLQAYHERRGALGVRQLRPKGYGTSHHPGWRQQP